MRRETSDITTKFTDLSGDIIRDAFKAAFQKGEAKDRQFNYLNEAAGLVSDLSNAGFEIVRKATQAGAPIVARNCACCCDQPTVPPDCPACKGAGGFPTPLAASLVYGAILRADGSITPLGKEAMKAGVVAVGERPLDAQQFAAEVQKVIQRGNARIEVVPAGMKLEPGLVAEIPAGTKVGSPPPLEGNARAVRDLVTAHALIARAEAVLGNDAVDEILNNLADPADQSEAA